MIAEILRSCHSSRMPRINPSTSQHQLGIQKIQRMDLAIKVCGVVALVLFALTLVFIGLAQAGYVHPFTPLGVFIGIIPPLCIIKAVDSCRKPVAERHGMSLEGYDNFRRAEWRHARQEAGETGAAGSASSSISR